MGHLDTFSSTSNNFSFPVYHEAAKSLTVVSEWLLITQVYKYLTVFCTQFVIFYMSPLNYSHIITCLLARNPGDASDPQ